MPGAFAAVGVALGAGLWLVVENLFWGSADATPAPLQRPSRVLGKVRSLLAEAGHPRVDPVVFLVTVLVLAVGVGVMVVSLVPIPVLSVLSSAAMAVLDTVYLVRLTGSLCEAAGSLAGEFGLRSLDALHLAAAVSMRNSIQGVITYDQRCAEAASKLGFVVKTP